MSSEVWWLFLIGWIFYHCLSLCKGQCILKQKKKTPSNGIIKIFFVLFICNEQKLWYKNRCNTISGKRTNELNLSSMVWFYIQNLYNSTALTLNGIFLCLLQMKKIPLFYCSILQNSQNNIRKRNGMKRMNEKQYNKVGVPHIGMYLSTLTHCICYTSLYYGIGVYALWWYTSVVTDYTSGKFIRT